MKFLEETGLGDTKMKLRTKNKGTAFALKRRITSWAVTNGLDTKVCTLDAKTHTLDICSTVPYNIVERAVGHYTRSGERVQYE